MRALIAVPLLVFALGTVASAEVKLLTRSEQVELADLVVTGTVTRVFDRAEDRQGKVITHSVLRMRVDHVEKGHGPRKGELLHAGYWRVTRGADSKGNTGQQSAPKVGDALRLFLARAADGGWELLNPNGNEPATQPEVHASAGALDALERDVQKLIAAVRSGDNKQFAQRVNGFRIPRPERWFKRVFGAGAPDLIAEYAKWRPRLAPRFRNVLQKAIDAGGADVQLVVERAEGWRALGIQRRASFAMRRKVRLYTVKLPQAKKELWSFATIGGRFRWIGKLRALPTREPLVVKIELSAATVDPARLDPHTLKVVIVNESTKVVRQVPTRYDGTSVFLSGRGLGHLWDQRLKLEVRPKQVYAPLEPKARRVVLEVKLRELFKPSPRSNWSWDWGAHPVPPISPIHRWRAAGHEPSARLVMSVWAGRRTLFSKPVVLTLESK